MQLLATRPGLPMANIQEHVWHVKCIIKGKTTIILSWISMKIWCQTRRVKFPPKKDYESWRLERYVTPSFYRVYSNWSAGKKTFHYAFQNEVSGPRRCKLQFRVNYLMVTFIFIVFDCIYIVPNATTHEQNICRWPSIVLTDVFVGHNVVCSQPKKRRSKYDVFKIVSHCLTWISVLSFLMVLSLCSLSFRSFCCSTLWWRRREVLKKNSRQNKSNWTTDWASYRTAKQLRASCAKLVWEISYQESQNWFCNATWQWLG